MALLECSESVPKSEDEFYLARETESFSDCVLVMIGCWPIIRGDYLEYACPIQTMLMTFKVKGEQVSDNPGIGKHYA